MTDDDPWGELFARAEGTITTTNNNKKPSVKKRVNSTGLTDSNNNHDNDGIFLQPKETTSKQNRKQQQQQYDSNNNHQKHPKRKRTNNVTIKDDDNTNNIHNNDDDDNNDQTTTDDHDSAFDIYLKQRCQVSYHNDTDVYYPISTNHFYVDHHQNHHQKKKKKKNDDEQPLLVSLLPYYEYIRETKQQESSSYIGKITTKYKNNNNNKNHSKYHHHWSIDVMMGIYNLRSIGKIMAKYNSNSNNNNNDRGDVDDSASRFLLQQQHIPCVQKIRQQIQQVIENCNIPVQYDTLRSLNYEMIQQCQALLKYITQNLTNKNNHNNNKTNNVTPTNTTTTGTTYYCSILFENAIRLMIACDATYYQLYYLQITNEFIQHSSPRSTSTTNPPCLFIPHPVQYFRSYYTPSMKKGNTYKEQQDLYYDELNDDHHHHDKKRNDNTLSYLHYLRTMERKELFTKEKIQYFFQHVPSYLEQTLTVCNVQDEQQQQQTKNELLRNNNNNKSKKQKKRRKKGGNYDHDHDHQNSKIDIYLSTMETLGPKILCEFYNSCRDYLCHLYSYATLSNDSMKQVLHVLQQWNVTHIIERGAGTGYLAHTLLSIQQEQDKQNDEQNQMQPKTKRKYHSIISIQPYDIHPNPSPTTTTTTTAYRQKQNSMNTTTSNTNEYHGKTPSYMNVIREKVILSSGLNHPTTIPSNDSYYRTNHTSRLGSTSSGGGSNGNTALLLCYPPPQNSMAYEAVQQYLVEGSKDDDDHDNDKKDGQQRCKKILIHIGEYKGLTGCTKFEKYVRTHFQLIERISCEHWGTDCSNVTIWMMMQQQKNLNQLDTNTDIVSTTTVSTKDLSILRNILVPCSNCNQNESIKRMRSCRTISYCCGECFHQHTKQRQSILQNDMMIHIPIHSIQYTNPNHFQNL